MTPPLDWQRVRALFHAALDVAPEARLAFVEAQADDALVVREVASLLAAYPVAEGFLSSPGGEAVPPSAAPPRLTPGMRLGAFEIRGLVGAGGMGEVYRAHDTRLGRDVAIKVLPSHVRGDAEAVERLTREARAIAALSHPGILTIHDIGHDDGQVYLVTELLDGESLRSRVRRGPLAWREALDIGAAMASALAAAHARGIVHRDLKPENVVVTTGGTVKLLDFGVAKHIAGLDGVAGASTTRELTATGATVGTLAYMAPEQLEGHDVDHRADQFSLGIVLYELIAGRHPFAGTSGHEIAAAILRDAPTPLADAVPGTPPALARAVTRCLARSASQRYASTNDLALALQDARADASVVTPGAVVVPSPPPLQRATRRAGLGWVAAVAAVAVAGFAAWTLTSRTPVETSAAAPPDRLVAVMPFGTIGDSEAYVADGVTEAVTRELGRVKSVRVVASNTAFAYRQRADAIGRELGVGLLVQGSVQRAGGRVRISTSLVDAEGGTTLWSERYDRDAANVLAIQDDIAWQIAAHLASAVGSAAPERPSPSQGTTPAAYDAYLRGLSHMKGRSSLTNPGERLSASIADFERAVAADPNFALAHAMLASAYTQRFFYDASDPGLEQKAFVEIEKALAINPDQAEAYLARGQIVWNVRNGFQNERAVADLKRAIANNPSLAEAHVELGKVYLHIGLLDKAIAENDEALRLDPLATIAERRRLGALFDARRFDEVRDELARNPRWLASWVRAEGLLAMEDAAGALAALQGGEAAGRRDTGFRDMDMNGIANQAHAQAKLGQRAEAERTIAAAVPVVINPTGLSDIHHAQFAIACAYALLDRPDEAVRWLTKAAEDGLPSYPKFVGHVDMAPLRNHPGYIALVERLRRDWERWKAML